MRARSRFFIGLAAALIAYSSLWAFLGPKPFYRHGHHRDCYHHEYHQHHCEDSSEPTAGDEVH